MEPEKQPKEVKMTLTATCFGSQVIVDGNEMKALTKIEVRSEIKDVTRLVLTGYALENVEISGQMFVDQVVLCPRCKQEIEKSEGEWKGKPCIREVIDVSTADIAPSGYERKMLGGYLDPSTLTPDDLYMIREWANAWKLYPEQAEQAKNVLAKLEMRG